MKTGKPLAETAWNAIDRPGLRYRHTKPLKFFPVRTTVLHFERPNGKPYDHTASLSPWSLRKIATAARLFPPHIEVTDERHPDKPRAITP